MKDIYNEGQQDIYLAPETNDMAATALPQDASDSAGEYAPPAPSQEKPSAVEGVAGDEPRVLRPIEEIPRQRIS